MTDLLDEIFDYEVDDWQTFGTYAFFGMLLAALASVALYLIVYSI